MKNLISIIFKTTDERQPWIFNFISTQCEDLCELLSFKLKHVGTQMNSNRYRDMEIDSVESNIRNLEQYGNLAMERKLELIRLYQVAVEYYSSNESGSGNGE